MKKKNTMPERDWQQTHEKIRRRELRKRILVMGLTVAMVANTVDLSALSVSAKTDESETGKTTIVSFEELSKDITEQTLPIGALESDIKFPTSLTVTVEKTTQADEKEADDEAKYITQEIQRLKYNDFDYEQMAVLVRTARSRSA